VTKTDLRTFINNPFFETLDNLHPPRQCLDCCWVEACQGGHPWHRYDRETGFDNPSNLCEGLKHYYAHSTKFLLSTGVPVETILGQLKLDGHEFL
jgi:sulfatase maturation enzyme AslB (radical SAM superfamily)